MFKEQNAFVHTALLLLFRIVTVHSFSCESKFVEIFGNVDQRSEMFYKLKSFRYGAFRKTYGINVTVKTTHGSSSAQNGLIRPVKTSQTIIFVNTPYTVPLHSNDVEFPIYAQGIVILYNLPGIYNLNMTPRAIAGIYMGNIKYWNDTYVKKYNPNAELPFKRIIPVVRTDSDQSTVFLTKLFSANDQTWNQTYRTFSSPLFINGKCCNSTTWPPNDNYMYGNTVAGLVGIVLSFKYTIGYSLMESVNLEDVSIAGLLKSNDSLTKVVYPNIDTIRKAMYSYLADREEDDFALTADIPISDVSAYPLTVFSSLIINYTYPDSIDCCIIQELVGFIDWFYDQSNAEYLVNEGYIPIINEIVSRIKRIILPKIACSEGPVYEAYLSTLNTSTISSGYITLISVTILMTLSLFAILFMCYYNKTKIDISRCMVDSQRIKVLFQDQNNMLEHTHGFDSKSLSSTVSKDMNKNQDNQQLNNLLKEIMIKGELDGMKIHLNKLRCKPPGQWQSTTKNMIFKHKNLLSSRQVVRLLGITMIESVPYTIFEFSAKGTLHHVLKTSRYNLTNEIKQYFALDTAQGMNYLQGHKIIHGFLNSLTCYLDSSWTIKITGWEKFSILNVENVTQLKEEISYCPESMLDYETLIPLLYLDPKIMSPKNDKIDVYSFGFLLLEVFSRKIPYRDDVDKEINTYEEILSSKFSKNNTILPILKNEIPKEINRLFELCTGPLENRPTFSSIINVLMKYASGSLSIVDIMMETVENHADMLEVKVEERTAELKKVTNDMQSLLNEVLPPQIAAQLIAGQSVEPELFDCVTIYFSDIVGFTNISAISSPIDVMSLLNDLWLAFDKTIDKFDAYKIDTIGDAYLVCSGIPNRNGVEHCRQIALLALALRNMCSRFKIRHLPDHTLQVRIGVNSGPVTAGVVGSKMPQYCVFGDTVNTASRMESTSKAQKIHMAETTYLLLKENFSDQFTIACRGNVEIKGKGNMKTYWLVDHNEIDD